jgi:AraC-like DNA-binding protein
VEQEEHRGHGLPPWLPRSDRGQPDLAKGEGSAQAASLARRAKTMGSRTLVEREISRKFKGPAPTLLSSLGKSPPMRLSFVSGDAAMNERSRISRAEDAYIAHILLRPTPVYAQLWVDGHEHPLLLNPGGVMLAHMENQPSIRFHADFQFLRCWIAKETLDEMAEETFGRASPGLRRPEFGTVDPVLFHLSAAIVPLLSRGALSDQLLVDQLAVALHNRLAASYSGAPIDLRSESRGGLAPWQERRAKDFIRAHLDRGVTLQQIASQCGVSASHFSRAFKQTTGRTPHRWLLERRVESSKIDLTDPDLPMSEIGRRHGFSDPSHFSRVFSNLTGQTPAVWRRNRSSQSSFEELPPYQDWPSGRSAIAGA